MAELTLDQQKAIAVAKGRLRLGQASDEAVEDDFQIIEVAGQEVEVPSAASSEEVSTIAKTFIDSPEFEASIDKETGAPARVRAIVGSAPPKDRLANLQQFFPDAQPRGDDNFVFTDPSTGRPMLFNPEGLDVGDVAGVLREGVQTAFSGLGAVAGGLVGAGGGTVVAPGLGTAVGGTTGAVVGAGAGSAVGGALFDTSMEIFTDRIDTRNVGERLLDTVFDFAGGAIGQRLGEIIGIGVKRAAGGIKEGAESLVSSFRSLGIDPPAGAVTGRAVATVEKALEANPISGQIMQEAAEKVLTQTKAAAEKLTARFGQAQTTQGTGAVIRQAAKNVAERFNFRQEEIYGEAFDLVGADTRVSVNAVTALREAMEDELSQAPQSLASTLRPVIAQLQAIESDAVENLTFSALRQVRTNVGRDIDTPVLSGSTGAQNEAMKRFYGALTEDMSAAAQEASPEAARKLARADRFTRQFMNTAAQTMQKIDRLDSDEKAFKFALSAARDGGTALARLRRHFQPEEWDVVAASVLGRMGRATPGAQNATGDAFSVSTFLTNWNRLAPEAKEALFGGKRYADLVPELNKLVDVVGSLKGVEAVANTSNTARSLIAFGTINTLGAALGGFFGGGQGAGGATLATLTGSVIAPRAAARLITNPRFVQWLTTPITNPNGIGPHLGRLAGIAKIEPELKQDIEQYVEALRGIGGEGGENPAPE